MSTRTITFTKQASKALLKMPTNTAALISAKIDQFAADPKSLASKVTGLKGSNFSRLRVGDWRVIFAMDLAVLAIVKIGPRGDIYD